MRELLVPRRGDEADGQVGRAKDASRQGDEILFAKLQCSGAAVVYKQVAGRLGKGRVGAKLRRKLARSFGHIQAQVHAVGCRIQQAHRLEQAE